MFRDFTGLIEGWVTSYELRYLYAQAVLDAHLPGRILEIGCYQGLSTSALMQSGGKLDVVDLFHMATPGGVPQRECFEKNITMVMNECQLEEFVSVHEMPSDKYFAEVGGGIGFRLCYVDGDHSYMGALRDFINCRNGLVPGGTIVFDDHNMEEVAAAANAELPGWYSVDGKFGVYHHGGGGF